MIKRAIAFALLAVTLSGCGSLTGVQPYPGPARRDDGTEIPVPRGMENIPRHPPRPI